MTRNEAIAALIDQDIARWGEAERPYIEQLHNGRTLGLALNELANRAEMAGSPDRALRAAARAALTAADKAVLRKGG